jgi:hypothetical protein
MQSFQFTSQVTQEGILQVQLPPSLANQKVEIVLVIHPKAETAPAERPIGLYIGKMRMSDDFSSPLPDEFWLGENHETLT